jgi:RHS repeat-associated core domain
MNKVRFVVLRNGTYQRLLTIALSILFATICTMASAQINKSTIDIPQIVDDPTTDLPNYPLPPFDDPTRPPTIPIEVGDAYYKPFVFGNYILERTPLTPTKSIEELNGKAPTQQGISVSYLDFFNRPKQQIVIGGAKSDIANGSYPYLVVCHEYDSLGREMKQYLPYPSSVGTYDASALDNLNKYYKLKFGSAAIPYAERRETDLYGNNSAETSLLGYSLVDGHNTKVTLDLNSANEVPFKKVKDDGTIFVDGYYPEGSLIRKEIKDANGKQSVVFTTEDERTIRVIDDVNGSKPITDYVYDDLDRLVWVLPPNVVSEYDNVLSSSIAQNLSGSTTLNSASNTAYVLKSSASMTLQPGFVGSPGFSVTFKVDPIDKLLDKAYYYRYDLLGRLVCKKLPNIDSIYMVYDKYNRLVATQDGNLRQIKKWRYVRYDELNRVLETGLMANGIVSQILMQDKVDAAYNSGSYSIVESQNGDRYTMNSFPHSSDGTIDPLSYNFYGTYNVTNCPAFVEAEKYENKVDAVAGLPTVVRYVNLTDKTWNIKACYYNADLRSIQTVGKRTIIKGNSNVELQEVASVQYDSFTGKKLQERLTQTVAGSSNTITNRYEYYENDLLKNVFEKLNSGVEEQVAHYTYDEFGRVEQKHYGYEAQKNCYGYDIRGALTEINYSGDKGQDISAFFSMKIGYDKPQDVGLNGGGSLDAYGVSGQYNGNVSAIAWRSRQQDGTELKRGYAFKYDSMNRLSQSYFADGASLPIGGAYAEKDITYDLMGNIKTLTRTTSNSAASTTSYSYDGNKLTSVTGSSTYRYDSNGNAIFDGKSGFTIDYNELNLPKKVSKGTNSTSYSYNANGELQSVIDPDGSTRYYMGNMVYDGSFKLMYVLGGEGLILPNNRYQYNLTDNLGSTRVVFSKAAGEGQVAVVEQSTDYYPYGKSFDNMNVAKNPYLYNGKELQAQVMAGTHFDWYSYGVRFYDPELGLWHSVDPKMEKRFGESGFGFCGGNPTSRVDPDGQFWQIALYMLAGSYLNASRANGTLNPFKWEYNTKTYSAMAVGAAGGAFMGQYLSGNNGLLTSGSSTSLDIRLSANYKDLVAGGTTVSVGQGLLTLRSADYVTRAGGGMRVNINKTWNFNQDIHKFEDPNIAIEYRGNIHGRWLRVSPYTQFVKEQTGSSITVIKSGLDVDDIGLQTVRVNSASGLSYEIGADGDDLYGYGPFAVGYNRNGLIIDFSISRGKEVYGATFNLDRNAFERTWNAFGQSTHNLIQYIQPVVPISPIPWYYLGF